MRKQRPTAGRRPKHSGVVRIKQDISMKKVAERRVSETISKHGCYRFLFSTQRW